MLSFSSSRRHQANSLVETLGSEDETSEDELLQQYELHRIDDSPIHNKAGGLTVHSKNRKQPAMQSSAGSWLRRLQINVEPVILLTSVSMGLWGTTMPLFFYWSQCFELFGGQEHDIYELCTNLTKQNSSRLRAQEDAVQMDVATLHMYMRVFRCLPGIFSSILLGAWSDASGGRKRPLLVAYIGPCVANVLLLYCVLVYTRQKVFWLLVLEETVAGLTGAGMCEFATMMSMVTDRARDVSRDGQSEISFRVSLATGLDALGVLGGTLLASAFSHLAATQGSNYLWALLVSSLVYAGAALYTKLFVRETFRVLDGDGGGVTAETSATPVKRVYNGLRATLSLAWARAASVWHMVSVPRLGYRRLCLNVTVVAVFVELFALDNGLLMLYVKRPPFSWSDVQYTNFVVFVSVANTAGKLCLWPLVIRKLKLRSLDSLMIICGLVFAIANFLLLSISTTTAMIYLGGGLSFFSGMMSPGFRGLLPKLVRQDETARIYTAVGIVVMVAPICSSLVFNNVYKATLHYWPGAAFFLVALIQTGVLVIICCVHWMMLSGEASGGLAVDVVKLCTAEQQQGEGDVPAEWTCDDDEYDVNLNATAAST